jgi:hypothetical protein
MSSFCTPSKINHHFREFNKSDSQIIYKESLNISIFELSVPKTLFFKQRDLKSYTHKNIGLSCLWYKKGLIMNMLLNMC